MKKTCTLFVIALLFSFHLCMAQSWTQQNSPVASNNTLNCVSFLNCQLGAAGGGGNNGSSEVPAGAFTADGINWSNSVVPQVSFQEVLGIQYVSPTTIYAFTGNFFSVSHDAGQTFVDSTFPVFEMVWYFTARQMVFLDSLNGYVCGSYDCQGGCNFIGAVLKTADGGITWRDTLAMEHLQIVPTSISFPSINTGFALCQNDSLYETTDGGTTWHTVSGFNTSAAPTFITFQTSSLGWAVGGSFIYKTTNGGATWASIPTYGSYSFGKIVFTDDADAWIMNAGEIIHNSKMNSSNIDSIFLPAPQTFTFSQSVNDLCMLSNISGYAVGDHGSIYKYSGAADTTYLTETICSGETYSVGSQSFTTAGQYAVNLTGSGGCDSAVVSLHLTVNPKPNATVSDNGGVLSTGNFSSYQWLYNGAPVTGATSQSFMPPFVGNYSVLVTDGNECSDTSAAFPVTTVGISDLSFQSFSIEPNPATEFIAATMSQPFTGKIILRDVTGRTVAMVEVQGKQKQMLDMHGFSSGVYVLTFTGSGNEVSRMVVKQ